MKKIFTLLIIVILTAYIQCIYAQGGYDGKLGYGFSPKGHPLDYSLMSDFLDEVAGTCDGGVVLANGSWRESFSSSGLIPGFQRTISLLQPAPYAYTDMLVFGWGSPTTPYTLYLDVPGNATNNWTNNTARTLFLQMLTHAADSLQPAYLFIGNEISFYWAQDSTDYLNWVDFYYDAYDSIKVHSPSTQIGTVFNYEHLSGKGVQIGWNTPYWNSLLAFDTSKIDILGLTVYPFFSYPTANDIPTNYLDPVFSIMGNKPIAITETGWPSDSLLANWYCSPQQQVDYVNKLFTLIDGHNVDVVNWLFLYYLMDTSTDENKLCASISMHDSMGNAQPALPVWLSYCINAGVIENTEGDSNTEVELFPNPASDLLSIQAPLKSEIEIFNMERQSMKQTLARNITTTLDVSGFAPGMYFAKVKCGEGIVVKKFIKQ
ncbi:MAG: T9SS type A sorting domain-containing protein [Bacteroidota bacterium]